MTLYYTTTTGYNGVQTNSSRSLGGFKSANPVINDDFSNLFSNISILSIKNGKDEYRGLIIKNDFVERLNNLKLRVRVPEGAICSYRIAVASLDIVDKYGHRAMENVAAPTNKPFRAQFIDATNEEGILIASELASGAEIGLWICRHIDTTVAKQQYNDVCVPDPKDPTGRRYIPVEKDTIESVDFEFTWD